MMIEEFVDFRVRAGETVREEQRREQVRRADERGRWLRSERRERRAAGSDAVAVVAAAGAPAAAVPAAVEPVAEARVGERRELADVAR
ncbi:hypothetical protein [Leifsonia sp. 21MFCrub1.1]|uniref:hypothetical protein n=1 Tax=Leifsonia sp. 21MFCrub1.1 TaxID=1798223 RepID=UPI000892988A|nr:hypothetical protein [Leifsonia sp. 21MFCrub1.1]SEA64734.1 hypothetical protein SAMN04515680_1040 [Leifsonia sp. 21MFCrub1.1]